MFDPIVGTAAMRLVKLLVGNPPQSIEDLIEATGLTRTAVNEPLRELVAAGFVRRGVEQSSGRGRPPYLYSVTDAALAQLFSGGQSLVAPALWRTIQDIGDIKLKKQVFEQVSRTLVDHYRRQIQGRAPAQRFRELAKVFREAEGNVVEMETGDAGQLMMRRRSCSFFTMSEESRAICHIDEEMVSAIVGAPVRRTACRHDGDACCVFEIVIDG